MLLDQANGSTMVMFFFRVGNWWAPFLQSALFYFGAKGMCETMFLHFVPVDGVEYFSGIFGLERYVFMLLCFQKTSLWTRPYKSEYYHVWGRCYTCNIHVSILPTKHRSTVDFSLKKVCIQFEFLHSKYGMWIQKSPIRTLSSKLLLRTHNDKFSDKREQRWPPGQLLLQYWSIPQNIKT